MQCAHLGAPAGVARPAAASRAASRPLPCLRRLHAVRQPTATHARADYKELLGALQALDDEALAAWAAAAPNRERLSLPFLGWLSDEEMGASRQPERQQALWELGSKLMALREGLSPVGNERLQEELRAAALSRCSSASSSADEEAAEQEAAAAAAASVTQTAQQQQGGSAAQPVVAPAAAAALAAPAFGSAVQAAAALGLSPEGMALFQQQAAALEAVVGVSKARSLTEVVGRAKVQDVGQLQRMAQADAAVRILEVLLSVHRRDERAAMLPDAFTPPCSSTAAVDDDDAYFSAEEDQVYTTPLRLLQAIDLYSSRLSGGGSSGNGNGGGAHPLELVGGGLGLTLPQLQAALAELREDVESMWLAGSESDAC